MQIQLVTFGKITEIIPTQQFKVGTISDTDGLRALLQETFPALGQMKYALAVNKKLVQANIEFAEDAVIAIMPPFSGG
ncbi:MoaD/ThiS family protein [Pedobacter endophyticus]|uniref:MoaD/ThiS family protein n=1 Tax=Pedobacter endophyticus TaxID=2789740 RepID=A0A7S9PZM7_9SPHI|nr:MoaD/ThiS family protein [Pedobacter endophyticus]QPH40698.1 MoaD/ThiS family protein [Pedobacter endophyticus]